MQQTDIWNANLYDNKHSFVFKYGEDLVKLLNPQPGERILDLGCGTGYLTNLIAESGVEVIGIDNSEHMIEKAKASYLNLDFRVMSADNFSFDKNLDAIFSNAVLHWVLNYEQAIKCMYNNLKQGGRIVIEFGGKNNVARVVNALKATLEELGYRENAQRRIWFFPSVAEYTNVLEANGFIVRFVSYYNRETELSDSENGVKDWIKMFGAPYLQGVDEKDLDKLLKLSQEKIRSTNFVDGKWYADYKRLRIVAFKE
jgi:trans-aconitate methyltransferase